MASVRLTNMDRDRVIDAAISASFAKRTEEQNAASDRLGRACYEAVFKAAERKAAAAMPEGWLRLDACLRFNVGGLNVVLHLLGDGVPVPGGRGHSCHRLGAISDTDLVTAVQDHLSEVETLESDERKARKSLRALLYSVNTLKALRELWPEGAPFFSHLEMRTGATNLPAPQITELNAMLGLQSEAA